MSHDYGTDDRSGDRMSHDYGTDDRCWDQNAAGGYGWFPGSTG